VLITVNGSERQVAEGCTVRVLVEDLGVATPALSGDARGLAVALDGDVVPRSAWDHTELRPGGVVEVVVAVQGG
jgi:sulfur carrier protein